MTTVGINYVGTYLRLDWLGNFYKKTHSLHNMQLKKRKCAGALVSKGSLHTEVGMTAPAWGFPFKDVYSLCFKVTLDKILFSFVRCTLKLNAFMLCKRCPVKF